MKLSTDCVQVEQGSAPTELKGAAKAYYLSQPQAQVWRHKRREMWHLVQVTSDPQARGCSFKQFLTDGPHLGWVRSDANGELTFLRKDFTPLPPSGPDTAIATPRKVYGEELLVYGSGHCARCNQVHEARFHLNESARSRFLLLQFVAEMSSYAAVRSGTTKPWTAMPAPVRAAGAPRAKAEDDPRLKALRSMRGGIPLVDETTARFGGADIRLRIVKLLKEEKAKAGLTIQQIINELKPKEQYINTVAPGRPLVVKDLAEAKLENVLAALVSSGNVRAEAGKPKKYCLMEALPPALMEVLPPPGFTPVSIVSAETRGEFMVGILICPEKTFVAASGPGIGNAKLLAVAERKGYTVCKTRTADTMPRTTIHGVAISREHYAGAKDPTASEPGNCAAPRLIQEATADDAVDKGKHQQWAMSEIYYLPNTARRTSEQQDNALYWLHGLSAHSCKTCEKLVPVLLCPAG